MAARGVSMIIASGDTGAAWTPGSPVPKECTEGQSGISLEGTGKEQLSGGGGDEGDCCKAATEKTSRDGLLRKDSCFSTNATGIKL